MSQQNINQSKSTPLQKFQRNSCAEENKHPANSCHAGGEKIVSPRALFFFAVIPATHLFDAAPQRVMTPPNKRANN